MPQLAAAAIGAAIKGALVAKIGAVAAAVVGGAVSLGIGQLFKSEPSRPTFDFSDRARGLTQNISNPVAPIPIIYGRTRIAGNVAYVAVTGNTNQFLHMILYWSEGPVESIDNIYFDDVPLSDPRFTGLVQVYHALGESDQAAIPEAVAALPEWTTDHRMRGVAHTYVRMTFNAEAFSSVPVITAEVSGRKVYDPRTGVEAFSRNPALCLLDYLQNPLYGRGFSTDQIDIPSFAAAATTCDQQVTNPDLTTEAQYLCDGTLNVDRTTIDNIRDILTSCRGMLVFTNGQYRLIIDEARVPSFDFDESNMIGEWAVAFDGRRTRFNHVRARYINRDRLYQPDIAIVADAAYVTEDNGTVFEATLDLPMTSGYDAAHRIAKIELDQSRNTQVIQFQAQTEGLRVEVGDVVTITNESLAYVQKKFRVMQIDLASDHTVAITAREYFDDVYLAEGLSAKPVTPGAIILPPRRDIVDDIDLTGIEIDPQQYIGSYLYSFENGNAIDDWQAFNGSTVTESTDARFGNFSGLFRHGAAVGPTARLPMPPEFVGTVNAVGKRVRVQGYVKAAPTTSATNIELSLLGVFAGGSATLNAEGPEVIPVTVDWQPFGFLVDWTQDLTELYLVAEVGVQDLTQGVLLDNLAVYVVPEKIDTGNIENWLGPSAISNLYIADASITTAKIDAAAISSAKIGTAEVKYLNVDGDAVVVPRFAALGSTPRINYPAASRLTISDWYPAASFELPPLTPGELDGFAEISYLATVVGQYYRFRQFGENANVVGPTNGIGVNLRVLLDGVVINTQGRNPFVIPRPTGQFLQLQYQARVPRSGYLIFSQLTNIEFKYVHFRK